MYVYCCSSVLVGINTSKGNNPVCFPREVDSPSCLQAEYDRNLSLCLQHQTFSSFAIIVRREDERMAYRLYDIQIIGGKTSIE